MSERERVPPAGPVSGCAMGCVGTVIGGVIPIAFLLVANWFSPNPVGAGECLTGVVAFTPLLAGSLGIVGVLLGVAINALGRQ